MTTRRDSLAALLAGASLAPGWARQPVRNARDRIKPRPRMGVNLGGINYWNTELPFIDLMCMSGDWSLHRAGSGEHLKAEKPSVDARGWLRSLPEGLFAMVALAAQSHLPARTADGKRAPWVVRYEGNGELDFVGALRVVQRAPGRMECEHVEQKPLPDPSLWLRISRTDPGDPLRNIRVFKPGTELQAATSPWDAGFIARWSGWGALRMMDAQATNNATLARWSDRPQLGDRTFAPLGLPMELAIDNANRCGSTLWLCMPHLADDDFIRRSAMLVRERLDERLQVWVEHSNEVWNPGFKQATHAAEQGLAKALDPDRYTAAWRWHARRSREIFSLWSSVFDGSHGKRLRRVLATQTGNSWGTQHLLGDPVVEQADVLAVAAYLPLMPGPSAANGTPSAAEVARWPLDRVFEHFDAQLEQLQQWQQEQRRWCARHGLLLAAYEGGQHAVGVGEAVHDAALERLFAQANRDERMGQRYRRLFDSWEKAEGDLFCHFSAVSPPSRWGNWGLLEHHDDDVAQRPKYRETLARMKKWKAA
jgi:hypothetical protein